MKNQILIVPQIEKGKGGGHLTRCIRLVNDLRDLDRHAFLFCRQNAQIDSLFKIMNFNTEWVRNSEPSNLWFGAMSNEQITENSKKCPINSEQIAGSGEKRENFELIVLDRFQTSDEELFVWKNIAPVIGIDEGGHYRDNFDFLIDILIPEKLGKPCANICSPALIGLPQNISSKQEQKNNETYKILITFGQEDSAGLGIKTANLLSNLSKKYSMDITLLRGALSAHNNLPIINNVCILDTIPNLAKRISEYDLVITHYGLTAYESLFAGASVLLAHPTVYHRKLAKAAGFNDIKSIKSFLNKTLKKNNVLIDAEIPSNKKNLAAVINDFLPQVNSNCPVCKSYSPIHSIARFNDRTYRQCHKCACIFMDRAFPPPVEYSNEYFFEQYKNQYGKTYLDDFDNIKKTGKKRLQVIKKISKLKNLTPPALLDIGCAYGPFLDAAREEGFNPTGIDPSQEALDYVQQKLNISSIRGFFPVSDPSLLAQNSFDVISLWYVLEHFSDTIPVFKEIHKLLKPNGILAFSTPSYSGISGKANLKKFLKASPSDHYTIWSPGMSRKALQGFKIKKIVIAGHHPERFPLIGKFIKSKKNIFYWFLFGLSKLFRLGDTFEVYAVKL